MKKQVLKIADFVIFNFLLITNVFSQGIIINNSANIKVVGNAKIEITNGNFVNNGTYTMGTENVVFSGTINGSILGSSNNDFYNLTVNNSNGVTQSGTGYVAINNSLTFTTGLYNTGSNYLIINDNATVNGNSSGKYINGNCRKVGNDAFVFPLGNNGKYAPIAMSAPSNTTDNFTASYFYTNPNPLYNVNLFDPTLSNVSNLEYWTLDRTGGVSDVSVTLYWDNTSGVSNLNDLRVARWNGVLWSNEGNTATSGNSSSGTITSDVVTSFSPFTFASVSATNPLPIELTEFTAKCDNNKTILKWQTAAEVNCDYFIVEKLINNNFENFAKINGSGNTNQSTNYEITDNELGSYYRLTQVDFNGKKTVFDNNVIFANCNNNKQNIKLYNSSDEGVLYINTNIEQNYIINVFDLSGKQVFNTQNLLNQGENKISIDNFNLSSGMYLLNINLGYYNESIKIIAR